MTASSFHRVEPVDAESVLVTFSDGTVYVFSAELLYSVSQKAMKMTPEVT